MPLRPGFAVPPEKIRKPLGSGGIDKQHRTLKGLNLLRLIHTAHSTVYKSPCDFVTGEF